MDTLSLRIATRYQNKLADSFGDPHKLLETFKQNLEYMSKLEDELPASRAAQRILEDPANKGTPEYSEAYRTFESIVYHYMLVPKTSYVRFHNGGAPKLFFALLQQLDLPPKLRKQVELCSRYYAKSRVLRPKREEVLDVYEKLLKTYRDQYAVAQLALKQGKPHGESGETAIGTKIPAGSFTLVNTGGFSTEIMAEVVHVVEQAERLLKNIGLGRVCYGDILVSNNISRGKVLAFYVTSNDEMFVRADLKGKQHDAVRTVCHELGHRLHYKFLKSRDRDIQHIYRLLSNSNQHEVSDKLRNIEVIPGDTIVSKGVTYVVEKLTWGRGLQRVVQLFRKGDPLAKGTIGLEAYAQMKGLISPAGKFVTHYAQKDHAENFAEMVSFYAAGNLPPEQVTMLEAVIH